MTRKVLGGDLITLITSKTFCNHILITRHFFSKLKFRSWKFLFGVYVIFMEFLGMLHLRARMFFLFVGSLEVVLSVMNLNQGGSRSKMGCSFRFRCQNCISTQSELKRAIFRIWRRKTNFLFVSVPLKLETRQNIGAFAKWFLAM